METPIDTSIEQIDIASDDMITILGAVAEYHATNGTVGVPTMTVTGVGPRRMAVPTKETDRRTNVRFDATELVVEGDVVESILIDGNPATINIV